MTRPIRARSMLLHGDRNRLVVKARERIRKHRPERGAQTQRRLTAVRARLVAYEARLSRLQ